MDLFVISLVMGALALPVIFMRIKKNKTGFEEVTVEYSEKVGNGIVAEEDTFKGMINHQKDIFSIGKLNIKRPIPPKEFFVPTKNGKKKIYIVNFGEGRFGYRTPNLSNSVIVEERDEKGNIIKLSDGKPKLKRFKWNFCDDVVEQDIKHWDEHMMKEVEERHRKREGMITKFLAPMAIVFMFLTATVLINQSVKVVSESKDQLIADKQAIMEQTINIQKETQKTQDSLNNLLQKVSGTQILENKKDLNSNDNQEE